MAWVKTTARRLKRLSEDLAAPWRRDTRRHSDLSPGERKNLEYDRQTLAVMQRCLDRDSLCIDGGAHRGSLLRHMVRLAPGARHHAFEPLPSLAGALREQFPDVRVHEAALGDRPGTSRFHFVENDPGYSGLRRREYDRPDPLIQELQVEVVRLDDVVAEDERPRFIKLDLEGGEFHALRGAARVVTSARPIVVFEAGERSSGSYGVSADMFFALFDERFQYRLSTMARWLRNDPAFTRQAFLEAYTREFFFIATAK